ncbi:MAG: ATP-binding cassette domain-containing protein, partial [Stellaceae bacterium]
ITGGDDGLQGMQVWPLFGHFAFGLYGRTAFLYCLGVLFLCWLAVRRLVHSAFGRSLTGIRENSGRMHALGAPVIRRQLVVYTISAALAGVSGALVAQTSGFVGLDSLGLDRSGTVLIMLIIGGVGRLYGAFFGVPLYMIAQDRFSTVEPVYWYFWIGLLMVLLVNFARGGVLGLIDRLWRRRDHRAGARQRAGRGTAGADRRRPAGALGLSRRARAGMSPRLTPAPGLALDGVSAGYGDTIVLEGISLELPPGETLALLGRNGVGKTTLLATIMGHTRLRAGTIRYGGCEIARWPPFRRARLGLGFVPQEREIFPSLSVAENLVVAARAGRWSLPRVYDFFPSLAERRHHRGNQLSGGEQQMLAIGRALIGNPSLLLMDEPLEGLAPVIVDALLAGLDRLKREDGLAMLLVEQHARLALELAQHAIILDRGAIVFAGASRELLGAPDRLAALMGVPGRSSQG